MLDCETDNINTKSLEDGKIDAFLDEFNSASLICSEVDMVPDFAQCLSDLFDKAIKTGQKQILCWFYYSLEFKNKVMDGKIKDRTARSKIYKEMKPFLPKITDMNFCKKTERA